MWELYNKEKIYYSEKGDPLTWDIMSNDYPQSRFEETVILTQGLTYFDYKTLNVALAEYGIEYNGNPNEMIDILNLMYSDKRSESTPLERIASSLEYMNILLTKIAGVWFMSFLRIRENFRNGLWTKKMVAEAVKQGYINKAEYYAIVGEPYPKEETTE